MVGSGWIPNLRYLKEKSSLLAQSGIGARNKQTYRDLVGEGPDLMCLERGDVRPVKAVLGTNGGLELVASLNDNVA